MAETLKAKPRREREGFFTKYIQGHGIDIGCGNDPLTLDCDTFEKGIPDNGIPTASGMQYTGDAHVMSGVPRSSYDWVYTSHIIEHLENPVEALRAWFDLVKPRGYLIVFAPHRDGYEKQRMLPSRWNGDHKSYWLLDKHDPPHTWSLLDVIKQALVGNGYSIEHAAECLEGWEPVPFDTHSHGEYSLEVIIKKLA